MEAEAGELWEDDIVGADAGVGVDAENTANAGLNYESSRHHRDVRNRPLHSHHLVLVLHHEESHLQPRHLSVQNLRVPFRSPYQ